MKISGSRDNSSYQVSFPFFYNSLKLIILQQLTNWKIHFWAGILAGRYRKVSSFCELEKPQINLINFNFQLPNFHPSMGALETFQFSISTFYFLLLLFLFSSISQGLRWIKVATICANKSKTREKIEQKFVCVLRIDIWKYIKSM